MKPSDQKLEEKAAQDAVIENWGARLVLAGLIVETAYAFWFREAKFSFFRAWGPVVADAAVFFGVWIEVHFNGRASKIEGELRRRSEERVAEANASAAKAELQAAEARAHSAEIERLTAWRRLSADQKNTLIEMLKPHASALGVWIEYENGDPEAFTLARDIASVISSFGLRPSNFVANGHPMQVVFGIVVEDITPGQICLAAFEAAGIPYGVWDGGRCSATHRKDASGNSPNLYIWVGPKPPPEL
jgi:hypothetical protein